MSILKYLRQAQTVTGAPEWKMPGKPSLTEVFTFYVTLEKEYGPLHVFQKVSFGSGSRDPRDKFQPSHYRPQRKRKPRSAIGLFKLLAS